MTVFSESVEVAVVSVAEVLILVVAGVFAARVGHLDIRSASRLTINILFPCACVSFFRDFSASRLARWSPVILVAFIHIAVGALLGMLGAVVFRLHAPLRSLLVVSVGFANAGALPFVLVLPLFANWSRTADDDDAASAAQAIVALYVGVWVLLFFSVGHMYLVGRAAAPDPPSQAALPDPPGQASVPDPPGQATSAGPSRTEGIHTRGVTMRETDGAPTTHAPSNEPPSVRDRTVILLRRIGYGAVDRNVIAILLAVAIGCSPLKPILDPTGDGALRTVGAALYRLGQAGMTHRSVICDHL